MKRRISFQFISLILIIIITFIIGATIIARNTLNDTTEMNLNNYLDIIEIEVEEGTTYNDIIDKYHDLATHIRITFIDETGVVLADSSADNLDNHLNRPEIQNIGEVYIRESDTLNIKMMYLATQIDNGHFLRVAIPTASTIQFLNDFIGLAIVLGIIIIVLSIFISMFLIKQSLKPFENIIENLKEVNDGHYNDIIPVEKYDEVNAFINEINSINRLISENIASLKEEKNKTDFLINQMKQGICVLDENKHIIFINKYLKDIYRFNIDININKDFRFLFREDSLQNAINQIYQNETNQNTIIEKDDRYYNVSMTYSKTNWRNLPSAIIIFTDITSIRHIENLKKDFFINASHELKSPLTAIMGSSEIIREGMAKDEKMINDLANRIYHEATRMNDLVMDMLKLSEIESTEKVKNKRILIVEHILDDVINNLSVLIKEQKISVEKNINVHTIKFNPDDFYQILRNIIENAIKYNKSEGHVWIKIDEDEKHYLLEIKDDGIGIPKAEQERIFERFYRVDKARSRVNKGTGLGLSIVKHIVLNANGKIELNSEEDNGTSIKIMLPKQV
ncbi:MAG: GHKL domain-containing protein [Candidatus Izimaplasma sp.]|nr:GHKL domain-containing protein [Candidatus Izimaplasma bacterium]